MELSSWQHQPLLAFRLGLCARQDGLAGDRVWIGGRARLKPRRARRCRRPHAGHVAMTGAAFVQSLFGGEGPAGRQGFADVTLASRQGYYGLPKVGTP